MSWFWRNRHNDQQSEEFVPPPAPPSEEQVPTPDVESGAQVADTIDEEVEVAAPGLLSGSVDWFNHDKGFGGIKPDRALNLKGEKFLFFHIKDVVGDTSAPLMQGEPLRFKLATDPKGRPAAVSVERIAVYARGTMTKWLDSKKFGFATMDDVHHTEVFVHLTDIVGKKWLKQGDKVGFFIAPTRDGQRPRALSVRRFEPRNALKEFADIEKFERGPLLDQLATMAQKEDWSYKNDQSGRQHPILYNYIRYTFARLLDEGKVSETRNNERDLIACFHTGLVTPAQEEIYGYFTERRGMPRWYLSDFLKASDRKLKFFTPLPDMAHYFDDPLHLLYDTRRELRPVYDHIYERLSRFPESFQKSAHKDLILKGAIDAALKRVRRNYKTAIPQFYNGRLQLLLPLCLESPESADLALVVDRDEHGVYFADTVLTLDMAYNDARLIARPDREWLEPTMDAKTSGDAEDEMDEMGDEEAD